MTLEAASLLILFHLQLSLFTQFQGWRKSSIRALSEFTAINVYLDSSDFQAKIYAKSTSN